MPLELSDIVDPSYLQAMLEIFSKDIQPINVASAILNEDAKPMVYETNFGKFCNKIRETTAGEHQCWLSDLRGIDFAKQYCKKGTPKTIFHICNLGLLDFCAPIVIEKDIVGYFFGGQIRVKDGFEYENKLLKTPDSPNLNDLLRELNLDTIGYNINEYTETLKNEFAEIPVLQKTDHARLKQAVDAMARLLNSIVRELHESHHVREVDMFMEKAKDARNVDELFELVVNNLPVIMNAKDCSIFTVQKGDPEKEDCLVLRKTSYKDLKPEENSAYYEREEEKEHLTAWVWAKARPLLLKDITNAKELEPYGITRLNGKYNDSDEHKGFLAVPIIGYRNQVIGVIRIPHKIRGEGREIGFTNHDAIYLKFLAHHLSPVIERQELLDQFERVKGLVNATQELARASSYKEVLGLIAQHAPSLFDGGVGKKYFVNRYSPGSQNWTVKKTVGDLALVGEWENRRFKITEGLTGRVIQEGRSILLHDLEKAKAEGRYIEAVPDGKSAMAAPLKHGKKIYGVIAAVSNKKFVFSEKDKQILAILAEISGDTIARTRWFRLREIFEGVWRFIQLVAHLT